MDIFPNEIVRTYGDGIYALAMRLCRNKFDAEDLFQTTFLKIAEKGSLDDSQNIKAYLYTAALNQYRKKYVKENRRIISYLEEEPAEIPSEEALTEDEYIGRERRRCVRECVSNLEDKYRVPVYLYYDQEFKVEEIAKILKIPGGTVKTRLKKARALIKKRLEEEQWIT